MVVTAHDILGITDRIIRLRPRISVPLFHKSTWQWLKSTLLVDWSSLHRGQDLGPRTDTLAKPPFVPKGDGTCGDGSPPRLMVTLREFILKHEAVDALNKVLIVICVDLAACTGDHAPSHRSFSSTPKRLRIACLRLNGTWPCSV